MLKIYGRANSINVRKVLWVAEEIGLAYAREDWGRGYRTLDDPAFKAMNPMMGVPVIDDDGFILPESQAITRYLAAKAERTDLYPADLKTRARIDAWMDWGGMDLYWGVRPAFTGYHLKLPTFHEPAIIKAAFADWTSRMKQLDGVLSERGPFLMGENFTIADIPAGMIVNRWFSIAFEKPELKGISAYYDKLAERAPYRAHGRNGMA